MSATNFYEPMAEAAIYGDIDIVLTH